MWKLLDVVCILTVYYIVLYYIRNFKFLMECYHQPLHALSLY